MRKDKQIDEAILIHQYNNFFNVTERKKHFPTLNLTNFVDYEMHQ